MPTPFQMLAQCTRLDISLKKNTTTFKFAHDLPVVVFYTMVFANKIFFKRKYFVRIYKLQNTPVCLEVCKFEKKNTSGWKFIFLRIHSHIIPRQVGRVRI